MKAYNRMLAMLEKEEDSRTKNDFEEVTKYLIQTNFANDSGYDLDENEKVMLFKQAVHKHVKRGEKVYKRG